MRSRLFLLDWICCSSRMHQIELIGNIINCQFDSSWFEKFTIFSLAFSYFINSWRLQLLHRWQMNLCVILIVADVIRCEINSSWKSVNCNGNQSRKPLLTRVKFFVVACHVFWRKCTNLSQKVYLHKLNVHTQHTFGAVCQYGRRAQMEKLHISIINRNELHVHTITVNKIITCQICTAVYWTEEWIVIVNMWPDLNTHATEIG